MTITFQNPDDFEKKSTAEISALKYPDSAEEAAKETPAAKQIQGPYKRKKSSFLTALENGETVSSAATALNIKRSDLYCWRQQDPAFDAAWAQAWTSGADMLEEEAIRRAVEGTEKPVFRGGEIVGHVRDYSDSMLMFLLKARRPELFGGMASKTAPQQEKSTAKKYNGEQGEMSDLKAEIDAAKRALDRKLLQAVIPKSAKKISE
jgi:hypothetical protein